MKSLGLVVIFALMVWSWSAFYVNKPNVSEQTMIEIQNGLQDQILKVMQESSNNLNNIVFQKFWTKELSKDKVQAQFVISFDEIGEDSTNKVERSGTVLLVKADEVNNDEVWIVDSIKIQGESIVFEEGLRFGKTDDDNAESKDEPKTAPSVE